MSTTMNVHSVSAELATVARKTRGLVPPKLVGASTTVVGDKMYLFGGRLVVERRMLSDLYVFDMQTHTWDRLESSEQSVIPGPRYFHSADSWNNHLVVFGGMGYQTADQTQETLSVLNDVCFFSIAESRWLPPDELPSSPLPPQSLVPRARYAHLSAVSSDMLFIIGGQDLANGWMDDIHIYDLTTREWVHRSDYPRHCGTYRSVALSSPLRVRDPTTESPLVSSPRFRAEDSPTVIPVTPPDTFIELPYSVPATPNLPSDIFLYSNYNFTDVKRELEAFTPKPPASFSVVDKSDSMTGAALPPGLRFPTGALLGNSLIIAGTYLAHSYQAFSIWSLDLTTMTWSRIEPGSALSSGSWCRAVLWREANKFLVFGNREGNLVEDYNHRLLSWDHVAYIDLEAFGTYQPPSPGFGLGREAQAMGLAALEDGAFADFEIICDDERRIPCSRKLLEERWSWFRDQRRRYVAAASAMVDSSGTNPVPPLPGLNPADPTLLRPDPRLTPRTLYIAEPYPVVIAFLQYLYAQALLTPLQHAPAVLSSLMLLSSTYDMPHLRDLVKHAMHRALSLSRSGVSGVYDVATLCDCQSLRLRAMRMFKDISKGRRPRVGHHERHGGGAGGSGSQGRGSGNHNHHARPRGMSDAHHPGSTSGSETIQGYTNGHGQANGASHTLSNSKDVVARQDNTNTTNTTAKSTLMRRPSRKSSLGRVSDLEPVEEHPSPLPFYRNASSSASSQGLPDSFGNSTSTEEDDDTYDLELLGLDPSFLSEESDRSWTPVLAHRISHNTRPSLSRSSSSGPHDQELDFFGTEPDQSPLTSSFTHWEKPLAFHLPYSRAHHKPSRSSFSDAPSLEESRSFGTVSTQSSAPVTPLSPALAEIVDAVSKVAVATHAHSHSQSHSLSRQASTRSIREPSIVESIESHDRTSLSHFPLPPQDPPSKLFKLKTSSLGNISEQETMVSPTSTAWQHDSSGFSSLKSPDASIISFDMYNSTPSLTPSLSRKSSFDMLGGESLRTTPVPQSPGTFSRFLRSKRSSSTLDGETFRARGKAEKLELKIEERGDRVRTKSLSDKESPFGSIFSGLLSPKGPRSQRAEEKRRKKEMEQQALRDIVGESKAQAGVTQTPQRKMSYPVVGPDWALARIPGL